MRSVDAHASAERPRSRSPPQRRWWLWWPGDKSNSTADQQNSDGCRNRPEEKMHKWAQKSSQSDATRVKELMDTMQIADFEKYKMVSVFKCAQNKVSEKLRQEMIAKKFPQDVISSVVHGIGTKTFYEKVDSHFEHTSKTTEKGRSNLYQYAVWCRFDEVDKLMEVSLWIITTNFKKGSAGTTTKNEIEGLKHFMEQETRADVLQIAHSPKAIADPPEQSMIVFAKNMHAQQTDTLHEDELINRMEITGFTKYRTSLSFKCPKDDVVNNVESELMAKKFPQDVIAAVKEGLADMHVYKKMDENFMVHAHDGRSNFYKYAIWSSMDEGEMTEVSMMCISASFRKKTDGPASKSEIEILGRYLGQEACTEVLKVHAPDALE